VGGQVGLGIAAIVLNAKTMAVAQGNVLGDHHPASPAATGQPGCDVQEAVAQRFGLARCEDGGTGAR